MVPQLEALDFLPRYAFSVLFGLIFFILLLRFILATPPAYDAHSELPNVPKDAKVPKGENSATAKGEKAQ